MIDVLINIIFQIITVKENAVLKESIGMMQCFTVWFMCAFLMF